MPRERGSVKAKGETQPNVRRSGEGPAQASREKPEFPRPLMRVVSPDEEVFRMWRLVDIIARCAAGKNGPVTAINFAYALETDGDNPPNLDRLCDAVEQFFAMPEDEQRNALNGWEPVRDRPTYADVAKMLMSLHEEPNRYVEVSISMHNNKPRSEPIFMCAGESDPVKLMILEGTTFQDALKGALQAVSFLVDEWQRVITDTRHIGVH